MVARTNNKTVARIRPVRSALILLVILAALSFVFEWKDMPSSSLPRENKAPAVMKTDPKSVDSSTPLPTNVVSPSPTPGEKMPSSQTSKLGKKKSSKEARTKKTKNDTIVPKAVEQSTLLPTEPITPTITEAETLPIQVERPQHSNQSSELELDERTDETLLGNIVEVPDAAGLAVSSDANVDSPSPIPAVSETETIPLLGAENSIQTSNFEQNHTFVEGNIAETILRLGNGMDFLNAAGPSNLSLPNGDSPSPTSAAANETVAIHQPAVESRTQSSNLDRNDTFGQDSNDETIFSNGTFAPNEAGNFTPSHEDVDSLSPSPGVNETGPDHIQGAENDTQISSHQPNHPFSDGTSEQKEHANGTDILEAFDPSNHSTINVVFAEKLRLQLRGAQNSSQTSRLEQNMTFAEGTVEETKLKNGTVPPLEVSKPQSPLPTDAVSPSALSALAVRDDGGGHPNEPAVAQSCADLTESTAAFAHDLFEEPETKSLKIWMHDNWQIPALDGSLLLSAFGGRKIAIVGDSTTAHTVSAMHSLMNGTTPEFLRSLLDLNLTDAVRTLEDYHTQRNDIGNYKNNFVYKNYDGAHVFWKGYRGRSMSLNCKFEETVWPDIIHERPEIILINWGAHIFFDDKSLGKEGVRKVCNIYQWNHHEEWIQQAIDVALAAGSKVLLFKTTNRLCTTQPGEDPVANCKEKVATWKVIEEMDPVNMRNVSQAEKDKYCEEGLLRADGAENFNNRLKAYVEQYEPKASSSLKIAIYNDHDLENCRPESHTDGVHHVLMQLPRVRLFAHMVNCLFPRQG